MSQGRSIALIALLAALGADAWEAELELEPARGTVRGTLRRAPGDPRLTVEAPWRARDVSQTTLPLGEQVPLERTLELTAAFISETAPLREQGFGGTCRPGASGTLLTAPGAWSFFDLIPIARSRGKPVPPKAVRLSVPIGYALLAPGAREVGVGGRRRHYLLPGAASPVVVLRSPLPARGARVRPVFSGDWGQTEARLGRTADQLLEALAARLGPLPWRVDLGLAPLGAEVRGLSFRGLVLLPARLRAQLEQPSLAGDPAALGGEAALSEALWKLAELSLAHELAHQYFGGWVRGDGLTDEAHAQFFALVALEKLQGPGAYSEALEQQLRGGYRLHRLIGGADAVLSRRVAADPGPHSSLAYTKAPLLLAAQRERVGDEVFFRAIRAYLERYADRATCAVCLTDQLAAQAPPSQRAEVRRLHARWWEQQHGDEDISPWSEEDLRTGRLGLDPISTRLVRLLHNRQPANPTDPGQSPDERHAPATPKSAPHHD